MLPKAAAVEFDPSVTVIKEFTSLPLLIDPASLPSAIEPANISFVIPPATTCNLLLDISIEVVFTSTANVLPILVKPAPFDI